MSRLTSGLFGALTLAVAFAAQAQRVQSKRSATHQQCSSSIELVARGTPALRAPTPLTACDGSHLPAIIAGIQRNANSTDTSYWRDISVVLAGVEDERLLVAAAKLALNQSASTPARLVALGALWESTGAQMLISSWTSPPPPVERPLRCLSASEGARTIAKMEKPQGNVSKRVSSVLDSLLAQEKNSPVVRGYGECLRRHIAK